MYIDTETKECMDALCIETDNPLLDGGFKNVREMEV